MSTDYIFETPKNLEDFKKENPDLIVKRYNEWDNESKATNPVAFDGTNYCHLYLNKKEEITSACRFGSNDVDYIIGCVGEYASEHDQELYDKYQSKAIQPPIEERVRLMKAARYPEHMLMSAIKKNQKLKKDTQKTTIFLEKIFGKK